MKLLNTSAYIHDDESFQEDTIFAGSDCHLPLPKSKKPTGIEQMGYAEFRWKLPDSSEMFSEDDFCRVALNAAEAKEGKWTYFDFSDRKLCKRCTTRYQKPMLQHRKGKSCPCAPEEKKKGVQQGIKVNFQRCQDTQLYLYRLIMIA
jgi:hypothetical protein